ncbi:hypothetical protein [Crossiella sp. NPDC003009]
MQCQGAFPVTALPGEEAQLGQDQRRTGLEADLPVSAASSSPARRATRCTDLVVGAAPRAKAGSAASISETSTDLGVALGVAVLGSAGAAVYESRMTGAVPRRCPAECGARDR